VNGNSAEQGESWTFLLRLSTRHGGGGAVGGKGMFCTKCSFGGGSGNGEVPFIRKCEDQKKLLSHRVVT